jgi:4-hydroxybenzoate polyprenyltransferase
MNSIKNVIILLHQLFKLEDLFICVSFVYLGAAFANGSLPNLGNLRLIVAILFCILGLASINSLNQIFDVEIDKINKPHRPIPAGILTKKQVLIISFSLSAVAGLLTIYLGVLYFLIAVTGLAIGAIYSIPQIYLKKNTFLSTMTIAVGYGILTFLTGWAVYKSITLIPLWLLSFLYFHEVFIIISKDFSDFKGDKKARLKTIPVLFGKLHGAILSFILYLIPFNLLMILQWLGYLDLNFFPLVVTGIIFGLLIFGFCSRPEKKMNYFGYSFYVVGTIVVRAVLLYLYLG